MTFVSFLSAIGHCRLKDSVFEATRVSETQLAERAAGYLWGEPRLRPSVEEMRAEAVVAGDDRLEEVARRFLG